jgi:hypothetical protein
MMDGPSSFTSSPLLVEDVILGLCGTLQMVWLMTPSSLSSSKRPRRGKVAWEALFNETIEEWWQDLNRIKRLVESRASTSGVADYLMLAYRGESNSVAAALSRITTLIEDGMVLYYFLKMHYYVGPAYSKLISPEQKQFRLAGSRPGSDALMYAVSVLQVASTSSHNRPSSNPLVRHALTMAANLTKGLLGSTKNCECSHERQHEEQRQGRGRERNIRQWLNSDGPFCIDGTTLCSLRLDFWTERLREAAQNHSMIPENMGSTAS